MTAEIIDLRKWEEDHPPIIRLWMAQSRCAMAWFSLFVKLSKPVDNSAFFDGFR
jgi:hypothetical protein